MSTTTDTPRDRGELRRRAEEHSFWYHTIDLAPGVATPGWFDLRGTVDGLPWPEVRGKRCLDIGTFDGFLAFEMERRGAAEVVAIDVEDHLNWDWPPDFRGEDLERHPGMSGPPKGSGFRLAKELRDSTVAYRELSIYDLDPDEVGTFDVVVCGSLLLHLRDPLRALEAVRTVTGDVFLSSEQIELGLSLLSRRRPLYRLHGSGAFSQWWTPNAAGHNRMLFAAGFEILRDCRPHLVELNHHPRPERTPRQRAREAATRALTGQSGPGVLHHAVLARPRV